MRTYPEAFLARMRGQLGPEFAAFCDALQQAPKRALRVNTLKTDMAELSASTSLIPDVRRSPACSSAQ